jgi:putative addiction module component (TIGR02574 family)
MTQLAEKIQSEALQLADADRAELARVLIQSLDSESDADVEAAWDRELEHRVKRVESGESAGRPVEDVSADLRAKHSRGSPDRLLFNRQSH